MKSDIESILTHLYEKRGFNFSGYHCSILRKKIDTRLTATNCKNSSDYLRYITQNHEELDRLVDSLTVNVSLFFRDPLTYEYLENVILPVISFKIADKDKPESQLRIWSAGCATGEEPYSVGILLAELKKREAVDRDPIIFATDINEKSLERSREGIFSPESLKNLKFGYLQKYFTAAGTSYRLIKEIRDMVFFSVYNLLDEKSFVPPESVYGEFNLVFCCNVLIYYNRKHQDIILQKLRRSLCGKGFLVLGKSETISEGFQRRFRRVAEHIPIYNISGELK